MFIKVNANQGFNSDQVGWWKYEIPEPPPPPPDPPATQSARRGVAREGEEETAPEPTPALAPLPPDAIMTLYMTTGGECVFIGADADKVRNYYSVPSSFLTVL